MLGAVMNFAGSVKAIGKINWGTFGKLEVFGATTILGIVNGNELLTLA